MDLYGIYNHEALFGSPPALGAHKGLVHDVHDVREPRDLADPLKAILGGLALLCLVEGQPLEAVPCGWQRWIQGFWHHITIFMIYNDII